LINDKKKKNNFLIKLEKKGVESRPIISGNFLKQPSVRKYKLTSGVKLKNSDIINDRGFFIGLPSKKVSKNYINKIVNIFEKSL
jgi:CDP-6-deoxy-D-xylo-4-hexulose-3-dehydrase